ncbi:MAG: metallophosphoesterase [Polyangia bacterium]
MGLGQYVFPRYAVHIASGSAVPIERLQARCFWYPALSLDGRMVSGHVLYISQKLQDAVEVSLGLHATWDWNAEGEVEGGSDDVVHRLAAPIRASSHASVPQLIRAVLEHSKQALPPGKRRLLQPLAALAPGDILASLEDILHKSGLHILVPLYIGNAYQLFTDATEALMPVSPLNLKRTPRLCFVLLSTDGLKNEKRDSPWLRQAAELMALPVNVVRTPEVLKFIDELKALRPALDDAQLVDELLWTLHELTGGWPDLCDRFFEMLGTLPDVAALRQRLWQLAELLRAAERSREASERLLDVAFAGRVDLPDLGNLPGQSSPMLRPLKPEAVAGVLASPGVPGVYEGLWTLLQTPTTFTWEEHGRGYLDGLISWERKMAVPRSRAIELVLRRRIDALSGPQPGASSPGASQTGLEPIRAGADAALPPSGEPGPLTLRWLHVSDFHFSERHNVQGAGIVLESLLNTLRDMRRRGRGLDCIFITGDIANTGSESEFRMAEDFLGRLCEVAGVSRQLVLMVPGNHDVARSRGFGLSRTLGSYEEAQQFFQPAAERWHLKKLEAFINFYDRFYKTGFEGPGEPRRAASGLATAQAEIVRVRGVELGVLPLNTAWFAQADDDSGKLFIGEPLLRAGMARIQHAPLRLAMMHHPLADLSEVERRTIEQLLQEHFHFVLRGHLHDNEAGYVSSAYKQTLVLAAGAAYQGRVVYQNRAMFCDVDLDAASRIVKVRPYPIRYEMTGHDRWTLDTGVFPKSYPTYLETLMLPL